MTSNLKLVEDNLIEDIYPASYLQMGMLLESNLEANGTYHDVFSYLISTKFDKNKVLFIWRQLIGKHELLRASFALNDENGWNVIVYKNTELEYKIYKNQNTQKLIIEERLRDFDYNKPGLFKLIINDLGDRFDLVFSFHHVIADGWSVASLMNEFLQAYHNDKPIIQNINLRYGEYVRNELHAINDKTNTAFWKEYLADLNVTKANWKFDKLKSDNSLYTSSFSLSIDQAGSIHKRAKDLKISLDSIFLLAYFKTLSYFTNSSDITIGLVVNNRLEKEGGDKLFGLFLNTLPFRFRVDEEPSSINEFIKVFNNKVTFQQYKQLPYGYIKSLFKQELYNFAFNYGHFDILSNSIDNIESISGFERTNIPFILNVSQFNDSTFSIKITAHDNYISQDFLEYFTQYYKESLISVLDNPNNKLSLTVEDYKQIITTFNATEKGYPTDKTIHTLFEEQVEKNPEAIAIVYEDQQVSYQELNKRANQLAHYLRKQGVKRETIVAISIDRSLEMIIGLLGILKSGGAYLPLDPSYPQDRLQFMLEDTNASILITQSHLKKNYKNYSNKIITFDKDWYKISKESVSNLTPITTPDNLAYVIYTSGSTGKPKGVENVHGAISNRLLWTLDAYPISQKDSFLYIATVGFDISVWEMIFPIVAGGRLIIARDEDNKDPTYIIRMIMKWRISITHFVPSLLEVFLDQVSSQYSNPVKQVVCGGEGISVRLKESFFQKMDAQLYHAYGPTEAAISVTHWDCSEKIDIDLIPIGRPISNTQMYILDKYYNPVPIGADGEIFIGGIGLARGYLNRPELTAEKFIANSFASAEDIKNSRNLRLYSTGDLGRYLPDGNIEFLGRIDAQVKIRGYRIELGEVESTLANHKDVSQAVVAVIDDENSKRLIAYIVPNEEVCKIFSSESSKSVSVLHGEEEGRLIEDLRNHLTNSLPDYMVPGFFVLIDKIPLTPNGKIDRKSLPALDSNIRSLGARYIAPRNNLEKELSNIWQEVLKIKDIGINDNFFKLGGHSLLATQVISRVRKSYSIDIPLKALFDHSTIATLSTHVESLSKDKTHLLIPPIVPQARKEHIPLSFVQQRLWFLDQLLPNVALYNMPLALKLKGKLNIKALEKALNVLIERHEVLRTIFPISEREAYQTVLSKLVISLANCSEDFEFLKGKERDTMVEQLAQNEANTFFKLSTGPLFRIRLLVLSKEEHVLLITMHHIISDGWSMGIFFRELSSLYNDYVQDKETSLPSLVIQYADFAIWQRNWIKGDVLEQQLSYWKQQLTGIPDLLELPTDKPRPKELTYRGASYHTTFSREIKDQLNQLAQSHQASLFMTLLAAFQVLLYRYSGQKDIVVGSPIANRHYKETEDLIGFFVNTLALRTTFKDNENFIDVLNKVQTTTLQAYQHQDVPFEQLVDHLNVNRELNLNPVFQVMFNFLNTQNKGLLDLKDLSITSVSSSYSVAKFDLSVDLFEEEEGIGVNIDYATDLFEVKTIERFANHFKELVHAIVKNPSQSIDGISLLTPQEQHQLLEWNDTKADYPRDISIHTLFEEQVLKTPNSIAIVYENKQLTYQELNEKANQLAHYLRNLGVGPDVLVAIAVDRSLEMIVGLLGVLKAGGAYVPLDPSYPQDRLQFMLEDSKASILITQSKLQDNFDKYKGSVICLDTGWSVIAQELQSNLAHNVLSSNLACVIYTSASSGKPKAVLVEHRLMLNRFSWMWKKYPFKKEEVCCQKTSLSFVDAIWEIFGPLLKGVKLVLVPTSTVNDPLEFIKFLFNESISRLVLVPSLLNTLLEQDPKLLASCLQELKICVVSGEALSPATSLEFQKTLIHNTKLINLYGSTEIGADVTYCEANQYANDNWDGKVSIGRPISNIQVYLLDKLMNFVPIGVSGEIYVGGEGLARGYLNRPELTAEKFIANPFGEAGSLLYRTGDLGKYLPDGNIEYLGRIDQQVKIRGFRIELGEIESAIKSYKDIEKTIVIAKGEESGDKKLVAYIVPQELILSTLSIQTTLTASSGEVFSVLNGDNLPALTEDLRNHLASSLPDYMVPSYFVYLDQIPLTPNGKIDRKMLPDADFTSSKNYVAPGNEVETQVRKIWGEVLGINQSLIGVEDNFFDIGGNSILTIRLRALIEKEFGIKDLSISNLFKYSTVKTLSYYLLKKEMAHIDNYRLNTSSNNINDLHQEIAVIGISAAFSNSGDVEEYWDNLVNGKECLEVLSEDTCRKNGVPEFVLNNKNYIPKSGVVKDIDKFDPGFWKISPKDATLMDPQIRKFLEHSWTALEKSGYIQERHKSKIGVFAGMSDSNYYTSRIQGNQKLSSQMNNWDTAFMNGKDFFATKVSYLLGLNGPSLNINTACSTSLVAIVEACKNLVLGLCDMAIAGGVSFQMPENHGYIHHPELIFSKDGYCRVFDQNSSGTVFGSGVGVVVLKRLKDALNDRDNIIAVVKGHAINNDGNRKVGYAAPSVIGQTECILEAQNIAQITADTIDYVECHGTGTSLGDPIEIAALQDAFNTNSKDNKYSCILGAAKANIGHADSAAGIAGFVKVCKMLQNKIIPPQIHFKDPNPNLNLEKTNFKIITKKQEWVSNDNSPRRAGVSAFGIGGTNAHAILEEYIPSEDSTNQIPLNQFYILPISAKSNISYKEYCNVLADCLESNPQINLWDVAYTLQYKREFFFHRNIIIAKDKEEAVNQLRNIGSASEAKNLNPNVIFMFSGQGTQYPNMARNLYETEQVFRANIDQCCEIISNITKINFREYLYPDINIQSEDYLRETKWAQPALFIVCYSLAKQFESFGINASSYIGHSIGEYVAATLSGVFTLEDALMAIIKRGEFMQEMPKGSMLSINLSAGRIREILPVGLEISVYNAPEYTVVSGADEEINAFIKILETQEIVFSRLHTSHAFHSKMMEGAVRKFEKYLKDINLNKPLQPFISNVTGSFISDEQAISRSYWANHIRLPVKFSQGIETLNNNYENAIYLEVGPGNGLSNFVGQHKSKEGNLINSISVLPSAKNFHNVKTDDAQQFYNVIGKLWSFGYNVQWSKVWKMDINTLNIVDIPAYQFEKNKCWVDLPEFVQSNQLEIKPKGEWYYQLTWKRLSKIVSPTNKQLAIKHSWLIFRDKLGKLNGFINFLMKNNQQIIIVDYTIEDKNISINKNQIIINLYNENHYGELTKYLTSHNINISYLIHGWTITGEVEELPNELGQHLGFYSLALLHNTLFTNLKETLNLIMLTNGLNQVTGRDNIHTAKGAMLGAIRSIPHEAPKIRACVLDVGFDHWVTNEYLLSLATTENNYILEPNFSIRSDYLWQEQIEPIHMDSGKHAPIISDNDIILISGGLGGIGLAIAKEISKHHQVRFVLIGRNNIGVIDHDNYKQSQLNSLDVIKNNESDVEIYCCDISNSAEVDKLISYVKKKYKRIDGVIHTAGASPLGISERNFANIKHAIGAKVQGAENLFTALKDEELKFFVMNSSLASLIGDGWRIEYCAANSYLDVFSGVDTNNIAHVMSINWLGWSDVGMALKTSSKSGSNKASDFESNDILSLLAQNNVKENEGAEIFYNLINQREYKQLAISKIDILRMKQELFQNISSSDDVFEEVASYNALIEEDGTELENKIAQIFCQILGTQRLSKHDSYFELGGNSLSAIRMINRLNKELNTSINLSVIFVHNTVDKLAKFISCGFEENYKPTLSIIEEGEL